jgi:hypothetical protein
MGPPTESVAALALTAVAARAAMIAVVYFMGLVWLILSDSDAERGPPYRGIGGTQEKNQTFFHACHRGAE